MSDRPLHPAVPSHARTCPDCEQVWELTEDEAAWYAAKGMRSPVRCRWCRAQRRKARQRLEELREVVVNLLKNP